MKFRIELPKPLPSAANLREHWAARAKRVKAQRLAVRCAWSWRKAKYDLPAFPLVVTLTRVSPRALDPGDNLPGSMKAHRDELAAILRIDDRDPRVAWVYRERRGGVREHAVEVELLGCDGART